MSPIDQPHVFTNDFGETFEHKGLSQRLTYAQSMAWYGSDKPDLRNPSQDAGTCPTIFARRRLSGLFSQDSWAAGRVKNARLGHPGLPTGGSRAHSATVSKQLGPEAERPAGPGAISSGRSDQGAWGGPIAKNLGTGAVREAYD